MADTKPTPPDDGLYALAESLLNSACERLEEGSIMVPIGCYVDEDGDTQCRQPEPKEDEDFDDIEGRIATEFGKMVQEDDVTLAGFVSQIDVHLPTDNDPGLRTPALMVHVEQKGGRAEELIQRFEYENGGLKLEETIKRVEADFMIFQ